VAELTGTAISMEPQSIGPVVRGLYADLGAALHRAQVTPVGSPTAYYEATSAAGAASAAGESDHVIVHAAMPVNVEPNASFDFAVVDLPAAEAATIVHHGSMDNCLPT
jgi:hypothetical protein